VSPVSYTNRRDQTYYLHRSTSKTGRPSYHFSMKRDGELAETVPEGYEIYKREFIAQRYCYLGSIDDWIDIGSPDTLQNLVKTYVKHLGQDSYFELF
jgi:hypothetical protein